MEHKPIYKHPTRLTILLVYVIFIVVGIYMAIVGIETDIPPRIASIIETMTSVLTITVGGAGAVKEGITAMRERSNNNGK